MATNPKSLANLKPFKPGECGNPNGKPAESRNRLTRAFLLRLANDFDKNGKEAIEACRTQKPDAYIKAIAALCPKEIELKRPLEEMADAELIAALNALTSFLAANQSPERVDEAPERESVN